MIGPYLPDINEENLFKYIESGQNIVIHGMKLSGKKTVVRHYCTINNKTFYEFNMENSDTFIDFFTQILNQSILYQTKCILLLYNFELLSHKDHKQFNNFLRINYLFIQIILTTTHISFLDLSIVKHFITFLFKNRNNHEKSIDNFHSHFKKSPFVDKRKHFVHNIFQSLNDLETHEIRQLLLICLKNNFDYLFFYYESLVFFKHSKFIFKIIQKAALCEHLSKIGNKKMFYIEHFLFFLKYGIIQHIK